MKIDELEDEALKLDTQNRAKLVARLLRSLDSLSEEQHEQIWAEEALRRDNDLETGNATGSDLQSAIRRIEESLT